MRDNTLQTKQWQCKIINPTYSSYTIAKSAFDLFVRSYQWVNDIRSVTVTAINLVDLDIPVQLDLFSDYSEIEKKDKLETCIESLRNRFGKNAIIPAAILDNKQTNINPVKLVMPRGLAGTGA